MDNVFIVDYLLFYHLLLLILKRFLYVCYISELNVLVMIIIISNFKAFSCLLKSTYL